MSQAKILFWDYMNSVFACMWMQRPCKAWMWLHITPQSLVLALPPNSLFHSFHLYFYHASVL